MSTDSSVQSLLQKLLNGGALSPSERALLEERLDVFDDDTAQALDALEVEDLALALAASDEPAADRAKTTWLPGVLGGGLALAASIVLAVFVPSTPYEGRKGLTEKPKVRLLPREGVRRDGHPAAAGLLSNGARVAESTPVLFRYRLSEAGWGYLVAQGDGAPQLLHKTGRREAGEHEVAADSHALALVPGELGRTVVVTLVVSPKPLDGVDWSALESLHASTLEALCARCGHHGLLLRSGAPE